MKKSQKNSLFSDKKADFKKRVKKLQQLLLEEEVEALLVDNSIDLFYLTGLELSCGKLLIHRKGAQLFVDGRYIEICQKESPIPSRLIQKGAMIGYLQEQAISSLAFESVKTSYKEYCELKRLKKSLGSQFVIKPVEHLLLRARSIKDPHEIRLLKKAAELDMKGFHFVLPLLRAGITEKEIARELEYFWLKEGADRLSFDPIIAFGANSSMPHYRAGQTKLKKGDPVLIDIGVALSRYQSDLTRVLFFGKPDPMLLGIYEVVREALEKARSKCRPGVLIEEVDKAARKVIAAQGYEEYFNHSLGHGVGLEVHEFPMMKQAKPFGKCELQPGMVLTLEPGIYLSDFGGVRLEDTLVITEKGSESLTPLSLEPLIL